MTDHVYRLQNHFVRHNTPHPKELKARHPKVFSKTKDVDGHVIPHNPEKKAEVNVTRYVSEEAALHLCI